MDVPLVEPRQQKSNVWKVVLGTFFFVGAAVISFDFMPGSELQADAFDGALAVLSSSYRRIDAVVPSLELTLGSGSRANQSDAALTVLAASTGCCQFKHEPDHEHFCNQKCHNDENGCRADGINNQCCFCRWWSKYGGWHGKPEWPSCPLSLLDIFIRVMLVFLLIAGTIRLCIQCSR
eukprot:TRINITY_DN12188_c0_g1_i1.p1 TRINITY_DN12188_c0_g1~~TRINITY_DN12188_c0_g1_i1.p1  ORF type:complete len:205 (-),score=18.10 TRINITY_DN12188_c0_g1_i1:125-658(-)